MSNIKRRKNSGDLTKHSLKFLSKCKDPVVQKVVLKRASDQLLKQICNAALNAERGEVAFSPTEIKKLRKFRRQISQLTNKNKSLPSKRKLLIQKGGGFAAVLLPLILSGVLSSLGSAFFRQ